MIKCYVYLLMLLDLSLALHFQDWSRKFVKPLLLNFGGTQTEENLPKFYSNQFYDPQWAFHIMDRKRDYKPNIDSKSFKRKIFHWNFTILVKLQNQKNTSKFVKIRRFLIVLIWREKWQKFKNIKIREDQRFLTVLIWREKFQKFRNIKIRRIF